MIDYKKSWQLEEYYNCGQRRKFYRYRKKTLFKKVLRDCKFINYLIQMDKID